jgi:hypothetical protein
MTAPYPVAGLYDETCSVLGDLMSNIQPLLQKAAALPVGDPERKKLLARIKQARKSQCDFWFVPSSARNLTVKRYEDPNMGDSAINGKLLVSGVLHYQQQGMSTPARFPVTGAKMTVDEHPHSGTLVFSADDKEAQTEMISRALLGDYNAENALVKALGKLEFVYYKD